MLKAMETKSVCSREDSGLKVLQNLRWIPGWSLAEPSGEESCSLCWADFGGKKPDLAVNLHADTSHEPPVAAWTSGEIPGELNAARGLIGSTIRESAVLLYPLRRSLKSPVISGADSSVLTC